MKIEINTTIKGIEASNYLLKQIIDEIEVNPILKQIIGLSDAQLKSAKKFRQSLVNSIIKK